MRHILGSSVSRFFSASAIALAVAGCNSDTSTSQNAQSSIASSGSGGTSGATPNVIPITVGGNDFCGTSGSVNQPCASVTICVPGSTNCQTISGILVDTGSYGLRIFNQAVLPSILAALPAVKDGANNPIAECAQFGTGSDWGPVVSASLQLGGEGFIQVPIQIINSNFPTTGYPKTDAVSGCVTAEAQPSNEGFNGILGIGLFMQDCGTDCVTNSNVGIYYSCTGSSCSGTTVPIANQVQNPVGLLPIDNNGVLITLPSAPATGQAMIAGSLILGIGTQTNNTPVGVNTYFANTRANFKTTFNGQTLSDSFIDSGSNGLFFPAPSILNSCGSDSNASGWYCPTTSQSFSALNASATGTASANVSFTIGNASVLFATSYKSFNNIGANAGTVSTVFSGAFDWGLPFFYGRTVFVGIEGAKSGLGTGPYWAY